MLELWGSLPQKDLFMMPPPRRPLRDATPGADKGKGKGKGTGSNNANCDKGNGKGSGGRGQAQAKGKPKPKAKATPAPWAMTAAQANVITIDPRWIHDPTYWQTLQVVTAERLNLPDKLAEAKGSLAAARAEQEAAPPPERRITALRKRKRAAELGAEKQAVRVQGLEQELIACNLRMHDARLELRAQRDTVTKIQSELEAAEPGVMPKAPPLQPGRVDAGGQRPPVIADLMEMLFQAFQTQCGIGESGRHLLETPLIKERLDINEDEAAWRAKATAKDTTESAKRARPTDEEGDNEGTGRDTPVAEERPDAAPQAAVDASAELAKALTQQQPTTAATPQALQPRAPPVETLGPVAQDPPVAAAPT